MQALIERIRSIFLEMGFSELVDDYVQSAGWNMDALFIPKTIPPVRSNTFYLDQPASIDLDEKVMQAWRPFTNTVEKQVPPDKVAVSMEVSQRSLNHHGEHDQYLASTHRSVQVFSVDRVFRKEAIDRTHLRSFTKLKASSWRRANLQMLVTTLKTFYAKMGYPEVRVRQLISPTRTQPRN